MRRTIAALLLSLVAFPGLVVTARADEVGSVGYRFKWVGPNDKIVIDAFDDPDVPGVTCYIARARTGGVKGALGLAEDPAQASISCRQTGAIDQSRLGKLRNGDEVFSERASLIFKTTQVVRFWDAKRRTLVYLSYTDRIIEGSPQNSISVVPVGVN
jgi:CreA protein